MDTSPEDENSAEKDREIQLQAAVFVVIMLLCALFFHLCLFLMGDAGDNVQPSAKICQNLLQAQRVTRCIPQSGNHSFFFEQAFPVGEVDLQYVETAMNGFEVTLSRSDVREYDLGFFEYVRFTFSDNQLKTVHYYYD